MMSQNIVRQAKSTLHWVDTKCPNIPKIKKKESWKMFKSVKVQLQRNNVPKKIVNIEWTQNAQMAEKLKKKVNFVKLWKWFKFFKFSMRQEERTGQRRKNVSWINMSIIQNDMKMMNDMTAIISTSNSINRQRCNVMVGYSR